MKLSLRWTKSLLLTAPLALTACGGDSLDTSGDVSSVQSGLERTLTAPRIQLTAHIRDFSPGDYQRELDAHPGIDHGLFRRLAQKAALQVIRTSANREPPQAMDAKSWDRFRESGEHRGYVDAVGFSITCEGNTVTKTTPPFVETSPGYTKEPLGGFTLGEELITAEGFTPGTSVETSDDATCATAYVRQGSRMHEGARSQNRLAFGYDAPFIWSNVSQTLCCDERSSVDVLTSAFPTHRLYVDGTLISDTQQRGWADFIVAGGREHNAAGYGFLAPAADDVGQF